MYDSFGCDGSSALKASRRELTLLDGYETSGSEVLPRSTARSVRRSNQNARIDRLSLGQLVVSLVASAAVVLMLCLAFLFASAGVSARQSQALDTIPTASVVVRSGDSLWSLAEGHPVTGYSTQEIVTWIKARNSLDSANIQAGQAILVPTSVAAV